MGIDSMEAKSINRVFAKNLVNVMHARKVKQVDLANSLGVTRQTVGHWEQGRRLPNLVQIIKIGSVLNASVDYLIGVSNTNIIADEIIKSMGISKKTVKMLEAIKEEDPTNNVFIILDSITLMAYNELQSRNKDGNE